MIGPCLICKCMVGKTLGCKHAIHKLARTSCSIPSTAILYVCSSEVIICQHRGSPHLRLLLGTEAVKMLADGEKALIPFTLATLQGDNDSMISEFHETWAFLQGFRFGVVQLPL